MFLIFQTFKDKTNAATATATQDPCCIAIESEDCVNFACYKAVTK